MQIIVNDTCCLVDLRKVGLLIKMLDLPYRIAVVYPVRHSELPYITPAEWSVLEAGGLEVIDSGPDLVREAQQAMSMKRGTSFVDCLSFVQTRAFGDKGLLLTNDRKLRDLARSHCTEAHGTLWLIGEFQRHRILTAHECAAVLEAWIADPLVFLPEGEAQQRLRAYQAVPRTAFSTTV